MSSLCVTVTSVQMFKSDKIQNKKADVNGSIWSEGIVVNIMIHESICYFSLNAMI